MKKQKAKKSRVPLILATSGGLLLIAAGILMATQNTSTSPPPTPAPAHEEETYPEIPRVSLEDTKDALDAGTAVIMDVRSAEAYQDRHIAGAINIPVAELVSRLDELDKTQWIITYCT